MIGSVLYSTDSFAGSDPSCSASSLLSRYARANGSVIGSSGFEQDSCLGVHRRISSSSARFFFWLYLACSKSVQ
jgi:hypothetical protein